MSDSSPFGTQQATFFPKTAAWRWLIVVSISILALAVRAYDIDDYPLDSHPVKQYSSALFARDYYYQYSGSVPDWKREVSRRNVEEMGLGPTILEQIAAISYLVVGGEHLWIPRIFSAASWVVGGIFLYLLALELATAEAALISTSFYLFLPFGLMVSRNFQPDPLMIMMMIVSLFAMVRQYNSLSMKWLLIASLASSLAILVKPVALFIIYAGYAILAFCQKYPHRTLLNRNNILFITISILPTALYYGYGLYFNPTLQRQAESSFIPSLLIEPYFWQFWLKHIYATIGFAALIGAMFGLLLFRKGWRRNFVIGLWVGYIIYGLLFTYHIHTHNYYQLPFIPIVSLSLGPLGALVLDHFMKVNPSMRILIVSILLFAIFLNVGLYAREREELSSFETVAQLGEEIGDAVNHSSRTILLAPYSGAPYRYHGEFSGQTWPTRGDMRNERLTGSTEIGVKARFQMLNNDGLADYFIVVNYEESEAQPELMDFLFSNYPIIYSNKEFVVFDLQDE